MAKRQHLALYGNITINRGYCGSCKGYSFIDQNKYVCCGKEIIFNSKIIKRLSNPIGKRIHIPVRVRRDILEKQENRCLYCDKEFGSIVIIKDKVKTLELHWDHIVPFVYSQNNYPYNFVAACNICNHIKSDMIFQTLDEARIYILNNYPKRGI